MRPPIHIHLARSAGFCFGVRRAIRMAHELARKKQSVRMLGELVHNETVIRELEAAGIRKIRRLARNTNGILLLRAHGASRELINRARRCGYRIADATCPMVREIHRIVRRMDRRGDRIIVIGDRQHDEVQGIIGQIRRKALVIDAPGHIPWKAIRRIHRAAIVVQSTQNLDRVTPIVAALKAAIPRIVFFNTICRPTRMKQEEIKILPRHNDIMIVIGSRTSANTRRLYEISRSLNPRTHWIQSAHEINRRWMKGIRTVGITAGASTPESATQAVIARIRELSRLSAKVHSTSAK
ncbi:MAG: 4-hydroxy-3-methylbut-2-enyl diphosphate reductase [Verrucomicrobia bacterium]|nr:4-hydroxy-3-methylbut-2-enyl diphosphate reductase [Verrucomicrobiota bacterium]MCG2678501.1 4-hydroxy-3-methylbut-2-enyl diphosphate reductase [Kiritimatiellia bacterium]MBU4248007.1 4-hydroxy-3-methylbut-2-enyl diphosphate reductase [Verrucomicrobiota bacterium]MBU4289555.1 4-hydroxy-3-methylbut-2-enyl diphosphate reductase [Verrucomicrobiota bacterium]MBU4427746.1 4-hydroxy-3-methylbut-2-enyl diphosphate reductase [Verrucomicrobiota bacterium]